MDPASNQIEQLSPLSIEPHLIIELFEFEGELVPKLFNAQKELIDNLRERGAEILDVSQDKGEYIIYMKQYSDEEQNQQDGGIGFHRGYTLYTFFYEFQQLLPYINKENVEQFENFLEEQTFSLLVSINQEK